MVQPKLNGTGNQASDLIKHAMNNWTIWISEKEETLQDLELHWRRMFKQPLAGADPKPSRQLQKTEPEWEWVSSLFSWCRHTALGHIHLSIRSSYCIATTTSPAFSWSKSVNCAAADSWGEVFCLDKPSQGIDTIAFDAVDRHDICH